ncbi:hypothetical protein PFISCL1PPCAC_15884, partial [Pristionchus fissidentatus]
PGELPPVGSPVGPPVQTLEGVNNMQRPGILPVGIPGGLNNTDRPGILLVGTPVATPGTSTAESPGRLRNTVRFTVQRDSEQQEIEERRRRAIEDMRRRFRAVYDQNGTLRIRGKTVQAKVADLINVNSAIKYGAFGSVRICTFKGELMAVKEMSRSSNLDLWKMQIMDLEVATMTFDCPYIVQTYGYIITDERVLVCMERLDICLNGVLEETKNANIDEQIVGQIAVSVLIALDYLKEKHTLIHRDVKPSNILVSSTGIFKLCDFGTSGHLIESMVKTRQAGCRLYMAPERLAPDAPEDYDVRSDVWSVGITLVELARGIYPYSLLNNDCVFSEILQGEPPVLRQEEGFSHDFVDFIRLLLQKDVTHRPKYRNTMKPEDSLLENHFFKKCLRQLENEEVNVADWICDILTIKD